MRRTRSDKGTVRGNTYRNYRGVIHIDLRNRDHQIVAVAKVDAVDLNLVLQRTWTLNKTTGYVYSAGRGGEKRNVYLHRVICGTHGTKFWTDHKDGDKLNNRRGNLRAVTASQSQINKTTKRGPLRQIWQSERDGSWVAYVSKAFPTLEEAQTWRDAVNAHIHGIDFMVESGLWAQHKIKPLKSAR